MQYPANLNKDTDVWMPISRLERVLLFSVWSTRVCRKQPYV
jgi:hypothetical protein